MQSNEKSLGLAGSRSQSRTPPQGTSQPAADELAARVAAALPAGRGRALVEALSAEAQDAACYEASVRGGSNGPLRAGRMMIEQAGMAVLDAIASALDVVLPPFTPDWLDLARQEHVPLIVGWDLRGGTRDRCVKLYVNGSDASRESRARLRAALTPGAQTGNEPPAVIGMNARADGAIEMKFYVQAADAVALADEVGGRAGLLAAAARAEGADAGGVLSFDVEANAVRPRAFFVALREPAGEMVWRCVRSLPGYDARTVESLLPFAPAPPRSVGVSLSDDSWTLYCKPRESGRAPEALEPAAIFRVDDTEVGVFVEPTEHAARAFRRTARHAVSVRVRDGSPAPLALESLVDWFTAQLSAAEHDGSSVSTRLSDPPAPWHTVDTGENIDSLAQSPSRRRQNTAAPQGERKRSSESDNNPVRADDAPPAHLSTVPRRGRGPS